jgi:hypothetical protein
MTTDYKVSPAVDAFARQHGVIIQRHKA